MERPMKWWVRHLKNRNDGPCEKELWSFSFEDKESALERLIEITFTSDNKLREFELPLIKEHLGLFRWEWRRKKQFRHLVDCFST
jgi:hypothetical protein